MARPPRLDLPLVPQHVVARGVNRNACFYASGDFAAYREDLLHCARQQRCAIHAYVLMTNHVHLLVTGEMRGAVSKLMQCVGRRYVRRFNASWRRTGTLFEGRFRASIVQSERYLLTCMRYIELNPVRARMVESPFDHAWSSVHANAGNRRDELVSPHDDYRRLGRDAAERASMYRAILGLGVESVEIETIRGHLNRNAALGTPAFQLAVARKAGRVLSERGRPRSPAAASAGHAADPPANDSDPVCENVL